MYTKLEEMLQSSLRNPAASQQGTVPVSYTSPDLLLILLPHLPTNLSRALFEKACSPDLLENKDVGIQKRAYRVLASIFEVGNIAQAAVIEHLVKRLPETSESVGHGAEKASPTIVSYFYFIIYYTIPSRTVFACSNSLFLCYRRTNCT